MSSECDKIARATRKLAENTEYSKQVGEFHRLKWSDENKDEYSNLNICAQKFGNGTVYVHTSSPDSTDDIDYPTGESIIKKAEFETKQKSLFIDAHNCLEPGTGVTFFGSKKANNMLELVSKLNKKLRASPNYTINTGFANYTKFRVSQGIGPAGVQVLVINCETGVKKARKHYNAYILIDGNNMVPGLRERILKALFKTTKVDDAEVFTTDNHVVNATMGGYNPVGLKLDHGRLIDQVCQLVKEAIHNCKPSEVGVNSGIVKNIRIFGQNTIMRLSTTINSTISIMRSSLIACQALAFIACLVVVLL
jgi:putative membrane protein